MRPLHKKLLLLEHSGHAHAGYCHRRDEFATWEG